jgi:general secretion pathway protein A
MYTRYFGLKKNPFSIALEPEFIYMSDQHREALAHLLYGIDSNGCIVLLTGDVGTGKTTLCRYMVEHLPEKTDFALILNPSMTIADLLQTICEEFGIDIPSGSLSNKIFIDSLNKYLLAAHSTGKKCVLIIDEAQNLELDVLEQLRLLTNLETDCHKLLKIVLLGQPELHHVLNNPQLIQISQRITTRYHLGSLPPADIRMYISHRITRAGGPGISLFSKMAIKHITVASKGVPRRINLLCAQALLAAYAESKNHVDARIAKKAIREILPDPGKPVYSQRKIKLLPLVFLLLLCFFAGLFLAGGHTPLTELILKKDLWSGNRQTISEEKGNDFKNTSPVEGN